MAMWAALRATIRRLCRDWPYASAVVGIIAAAVAINGAVFTAVTAVLLRPLPIANPHELVVGWGTDSQRHLPLVEFSHRNISDWAARSRTLASVAAMGSSTWPAALVGEGPPRRLWSAGVSGSFFETLGATAAVGRTLGPQDDQPNAPPVAVISHRLWTTHFGSDHDIVGRPLRLDGQTRTIVGVMPRWMDLPRGTDFWSPIVPVLTGGDPTHANLTNVGVLFLVGRLAPGADLDMARHELDAIAARTAREDGTPRFGTDVVLTPLPTVLFGPVRTVLWLSVASVLLLAITAAANVAALLLSRAVSRRSADGVRLALGASPRVVAGRWVGEVMLLAVTGGVIGLLLSWGVTRALVATAPEDLYRLDSIGSDVRVMAVTLLVTLATALATALVIAWATSRQSPARMLDANTRHTSSRAARRTRAALVVVQVACASLLLVVAALIARSFVSLRHMDVGFTPASAVVLNLEPRADDANAWMQQVLSRFDGRSDLVTGALYLRPLALGAIGQEVAVRLHGQAKASADARANPALNYQIAGPRTFRALGVPITRGRAFLPTDDRSAPRVVVVGETTARRLWPGADAVGQRLAIDSVGPNEESQRWRTVVGVVGDVRYRGIRDVRLDVYDAALQAPTPATDVVVRATGDPLAAAAEVIDAARALDPHVLVDGVTPLASIVDRATAPWRFGMTLLTIFAVAAAIIAAGGLFAVVALETAQARHALAIRAALGARPGVLLRMVLGQAARHALLGTGLGLLLALAAAPWLRVLLEDVAPSDPVVLTGVSAVVLALSIVAAMPSALTAAHARPVTLMR